MIDTPTQTFEKWQVEFRKELVWRGRCDDSAAKIVEQEADWMRRKFEAGAPARETAANWDTDN
jgi:hypothetical protein